MIPSGEDNHALYSGLASDKTATNGYPSSKASKGFSQLNDQDSEAQLADASSRKVVWDADGDAAHVPGSEDAEGEPDPAYEHLQSADEKLRLKPLGVRDLDGTLRPWVAPPLKTVIVKSKRTEDRSINLTSQTSTLLVCRDFFLSDFSLCPFNIHLR